MAKINYIRKASQRTKRWRHEKVLLKRFVFRLSLTCNGVIVFLFLHKNGYLTTVYEKVAPILESLTNLLPL